MQVAHRIVGVGGNSVAGESGRERCSRAGFIVFGQPRDVAVAVVREEPLGSSIRSRVRCSRIVLRIRQAPHAVVDVGIGVGAVRVGECRFGNVPVPARVRARLLGGGVAQGLTEQATEAVLLVNAVKGWPLYYDHPFNES